MLKYMCYGIVKNVYIIYMIKITLNDNSNKTTRSNEMKFKLTKEIIEENINIKDLDIKFYENLMGHYVAEFHHKSEEAISDLNRWFLDHFPYLVNDIRYGKNRSEGNYYLFVNVAN